MEKECAVKNCKGKYGGWVDVSWMKKKKFQLGSLPFCEAHFNKVFPKIKEAEKEMQKKDGKNTFWAFVPREELEKALN